jgi:NAD(P)-dependent dehydrogenase (short-subunit alcohol dehydrogenase family)
MARMEQLLLATERRGSDLRSRAYGLSKWWMLRQCERLAPAWGRRGARITTVSPGMIDTPMGRREALDKCVAALIESAPLARWGRPVEIADAVEFLVSERAAFITGADLRVDGGAVCKRRESGT